MTLAARRAARLRWAAFVVPVLVPVLVLSAPHAAAAEDPGWPAGSPRTAGSDRFETAALLALRTFSRADTVVLANGVNGGIDALSASYLAGVLHAPVLLSTADELPDVTVRAIEAIDPEQVVVVGGAPSVSDESLEVLDDDGYALSRIAGEDRYATSVAVWRAAAASGAPAPAEVFVARADVAAGDVAADALAAAPVAYRAGVPVVLTARDRLPPVSAAALAASPSVTTVTVLGAESAVSTATAAAAARAARLSGVRRLAGADRTGTAAAIADAYGPPAPAEVLVANGYRVDALAAGPVAGERGASVLLVAGPDAPGAAQSFARTHAASLRTAELVGGWDAVSSSVLERMRADAPSLAAESGRWPDAWDGAVGQTAVLIYTGQTAGRWPGSVTGVVDGREVRFNLWPVCYSVDCPGWTYPDGVPQPTFVDDGDRTIFTDRLQVGDVLTATRMPSGEFAFGNPFGLQEVEGYLRFAGAARPTTWTGSTSAWCGRRPYRARRAGPRRPSGCGWTRPPTSTWTPRGRGSTSARSSAATTRVCGSRWSATTAGGRHRWSCAA